VPAKFWRLSSSIRERITWRRRWPSDRVDTKMTANLNLTHKLRFLDFPLLLLPVASFERR
jgi:hypothetical protein